MSVLIYIEGQRLDLFEDENISVTSNVSDVKDLKLKADFSQSFTVPASNNNNQIFQTWYNFDVINGFDARTRKTASLDLDTLDFKRGKIRLEKAKIENGRPVNYTITFFGNTVKIKDLLGDDKLFDLTWLSNFDHDYTDANVQTGLTTGLDFTVGAETFTKAIIYPLVSYKRQYLYDSDPTDTTATDTLVNIAYDAGRTDGVDWAELKPAINLPIIIRAIKEKYDLDFTGTFFNTQRYKEIYMNLSTDNETLENGVNVVEEISGTSVQSTAIRYVYTCQVTPDAGFESVGYKIRLSINGVEVAFSPTLTGTDSFNGIADWTEDYDVKAEVITEEDFEFSAVTTLKSQILSFTLEYTNSYTGLAVDLETIITDQIQDIKVFDFLLSLIKMFNLIVTSDSDNADNLYWQDQQTWYSEGQIYDVSPYIDTKETTVSKGKIYSQINFKFEDTDQILSENYRESFKKGFGNIEQKLTDENDNLLDGDTLDIEVLFENPMNERLFDEDDNTQTSIQYCLMLDKGLGQFTGNPFLFYAPAVSIGSNTIGFKGLSTYTEISTSVLMPSHSESIDTDSFTLQFDAEFNEYTSTVFTDTIYQRFYADYINDIFSVQRRIIDVKGILPLSLLHNLKLNDRLIIQDTRYIINKITSNLVNREDSLELLNDIYDAPLASDSLNTSLFSPAYGFFNYNAQSRNATYYGLVGKTVKTVDTGDGTGWITLNTATTLTAVFEVEYDLDENTSGTPRSVNIQVLDSINDPIFTVVQESLVVGAMAFSNPDNSGLLVTVLNVKQ